MFTDEKFNLKSEYPIAVNSKKVGSYPALTKSGGGYFWDEVLVYRVWLHPELGAKKLYGNDDYFYSFPTYESALNFKDNNKGSEDPLVLILQKEWIDEPQPKEYIHKKGKRITEWQVVWLKGSKREKDSIISFIKGR